MDDEDGLGRWKPKHECTLILVISSISVMLHLRATDSELEGEKDHKVPF